MSGRRDPDEDYYIRLFSTYFDSGSWITREGRISLSLEPRSAWNWNATQRTEAWNSVFARHHRDNNWYNTDGMRGSFFAMQD